MLSNTRISVSPEPSPGSISVDRNPFVDLCSFGVRADERVYTYRCADGSDFGYL